MRDYALQQALSFEQVGVPALSRLWRNFMARRAIAKLTAYDDVLLDDIGVTRAEIAAVLRLPLSENAALVLEERSFRRRRLSRR